MKKRKLIQGGIAILMAIFVLALAGCPQGTEDPTDEDVYVEDPVTQEFTGTTGTIKYGKPVIKDSSQKYIDPIWGKVTTVFPLEKIFEGDTNMEFWVPGSTTGVGRALWDENGLYVFVKVKDAEVDTESSATHEQDSVELFINEAVKSDNTLITVPQGIADKGGQYRVSADGLASGDPTSASDTMTKYSGWRTSDGYIVIFHAPWQFKPQYPVKGGKKIGFELQINACSSGSRDGAVVWQNTLSGGYQNVTNYGVVTLDATGAPSFEVNAALPAISVHPASASYAPTATAAALTVTAAASDGGTLSYQWYSNTTDSYEGGTAIVTTPSHTPDITTEGTTYYWVDVKNTKDGKTSTAVRSNRATIIVAAGEMVEKLVVGGSSIPVYRFTPPSGKTWSNYAKWTFTVLVADQTSYDQTSTRGTVAGNYDATKFDNTGTYSQGTWGNERMVDIGGGSVLKDQLGSPGLYTWKTVEVTIPQTGGIQPEATASGPFYFGLGYTMNQNGWNEGDPGRDTTITYYIKDVAMVEADGTTLLPADDLGVALDNGATLGQLWCKFHMTNGKTIRSMVPLSETQQN